MDGGDFAARFSTENAEGEEKEGPGFRAQKTKATANAVGAAGAEERGA